MFITGEKSSAEILTDDIDQHTFAQVGKLCDLEYFKKVDKLFMPDIHAGKVSPIGAVYTFNKKDGFEGLMPALISTDIGCGVTVAKVEGKFELQKLDSVIKEHIPVGNKKRNSANTIPPKYFEQIEHFLSYYQGSVYKKLFNMEKAKLSMGTLGGGNHFIELDIDDDTKDRYLIIHSGSRSVGAFVYDFYRNIAENETEKYYGKVDKLYEFLIEEESISNYISAVVNTITLASLNRLIMLNIIASNMKWSIDSIRDIPHNFLELSNDSLIIRKGSIKAELGDFVAIPVNMKDGVIIGHSKGNPKWENSAPHGSGRIIPRSEVKNFHTLNEFKKIMKGIYSSSVTKDTLDEGPFAYRDMETIKKVIEPAIHIDTIIRPVYSMKGGNR